jgi:hypothetical protein
MDPTNTFIESDSAITGFYSASPTGTAVTPAGNPNYDVSNSFGLTYLK